MGKVSQPIKSISDLVEYLNRDIKPKEIVWFRGHSKANWKLLPSLARKTKWLSAESALISKFKQNSSLLLTRPPMDDWDWLTVMQHHRVPTRLLDWTENPLVALYFVVCEQQKYDGALWVLYPCMLNKISNINPDYPNYIPNFYDKELNPYTPEIVKSEKTSRMKSIAVIGPRNTPRMQAQLGVFSITHRDLTPIEALGDKKHVIKYLVPKNSKNKILKELSLLGVGRFQLFPELDSIGTMLKGDLTK